MRALFPLVIAAASFGCSSSGGGGGTDPEQAKRLTGHANGETVDGRTIALEGCTADQRGDNGAVRVTNSMGETLTQINVASGCYEQDVEIASGKNDVRVTIREGSAQVEDVEITVTNTAPAAPARVRLTWDKDSADVDLYVTGPGGDTASFGSPQIASGYLDIDDVDGFGPETFTVLGSSAGKHTLKVNYFDTNGQSAAVGATVTVSFYEQPWSTIGTHTFSPSDADQGTSFWELPSPVIVE